MIRENYQPSDDILSLASQMTPARFERLRYAVSQRQRGLMLVMEDVKNPHNLAAVARTCDAFGIQNIAFSIENEEVYDYDPHEVGRYSSMSANKWVDFELYDQGSVQCLNSLKTQGWHILASSVSEGAAVYTDVDFTQYDKLALLVGNERFGIREKTERMADSLVTIPMQGIIRSLNVSVAAAVILAEITRQRKASPLNFGISQSAADDLLREFIRRANPRKANVERDR